MTGSHPTAHEVPRIHRPAEAGVSWAHWRINGFPATLYIWTDEAYRNLPERPADAQFHPCGLWCALRMDD
jgi:hypothetical protein